MPSAPLRLAAGLALGGLFLSACSSSPPKALGPSEILRSSPATRTVHLLLESAETNAVAGFNFDGYGDGAMRVSIPMGWTVVVTCVNESTAFTHSCAIVENAAPTTSGAPLAFPGASVPSAADGLAYHKTATFQFVASRTGTYRIACLVTGHELDGMWDWFNVTAGGKPSVSVSR